MSSWFSQWGEWSETYCNIGVKLQHGSSDVGSQGHVVTHSSLVETWQHCILTKQPQSILLKCVSITSLFNVIIHRNVTEQNKNEAPLNGVMFHEAAHPCTVTLRESPNTEQGLCNLLLESQDSTFGSSDCVKRPGWNWVFLTFLLWAVQKTLKCVCCAPAPQPLMVSS